MPKPPKSKPLMGILWADARSDLEIIHEPWMIMSYGFVVQEDKTGISLANEDMLDGTYRGFTFIPHGMVKEKWVVSVNPRRKRQKHD